MSNKAAFSVLFALLLMASTLWAGGQPESDDQGKSAGTAAGQSTGIGEQLRWATTADYQRQTGNTIKSLGEAPMLAEKVAAGVLPRVEERLPDEPYVVKPLHSIGKYGGTITTGLVGTATWEYNTMNAEGLFTVTHDLTVEGIVPNVATAWEWNDDLTKLTVILRKGLKWSDGEPFDADDVMFWYEDVLLNKEITPVIFRDWQPGGVPVQVEKIDDWTVSFEFAIPFPPIMTNLARHWGGNNPFLPSHWMKQFHIKHNPNADTLAGQEGFDEWWMMFQNKLLDTNDTRQQDFDRPTLNPWLLVDVDNANNRYLERNPYYWKIDTAGNQLPYLDKHFVVQIANEEVYNLKAIAGELTIAARSLSLEKQPLYKDGEQKGGYRALLWDWPRGSETAYVFNMTHKDPALREIFRDLRFREAMSHAIDRDTMNETLFFGMATSRQAVTIPSTTFFEEWMGQHAVEYDVDKASKLLDEVGLKWDGDRRYRLRPDGKPFAITIEFSAGGGPKAQIHELVRENWEAVGVKTAVKEVQRRFYRERLAANEVDVGTWHFDQISAFGMYRFPFAFTIPFRFGAQGYHDWYATNGQEGMVPPQWVQDLYNTVEEWRTTVPGSKEYEELGKEFLTIIDDNMPSVGTVGMVPWPVIVKANLRNIPDHGSLSGEWGFWNGFLADTWYFE